MSTANDKFTLHDLRVEVICPPNEKIYCGAKEGDHFILRGEMLHLPEGQGFSIYSLGITSYSQSHLFFFGFPILICFVSCGLTFASSKTKINTSKRLDDNRQYHRMSRSEL